jgi:hypothetical protein
MEEALYETTILHQFAGLSLERIPLIVAPSVFQPDAG